METIIDVIKLFEDTFEDTFEGIIPYPLITFKIIATIILLALTFLIFKMIWGLMNSGGVFLEEETLKKNKESEKIEISKSAYIWIVFIFPALILVTFSVLTFIK